MGSGEDRSFASSAVSAAGTKAELPSPPLSRQPSASGTAERTRIPPRQDPAPTRRSGSSASCFPLQADLHARRSAQACCPLVKRASPLEVRMRQEASPSRPDPGSGHWTSASKASWDWRQASSFERDSAATASSPAGKPAAAQAQGARSRRRRAAAKAVRGRMRPVWRRRGRRQGDFPKIPFSNKPAANPIGRLRPPPPL